MLHIQNELLVQKQMYCHTRVILRRAETKFYRREQMKWIQEELWPMVLNLLSMVVMYTWPSLLCLKTYHFEFLNIYNPHLMVAYQSIRNADLLQMTSSSTHGHNK
jgi:hypothetical protein